MAWYCFGLIVQKCNLTNHAKGVYIINSARNCISSKRNALYIIIAKAKYSLQLMICTFGDEIHAKAWWYTIAFAMDKKRPSLSTWSFLAPPVGLEPTTLRLTAACSTDWAKEECRHRPIFPDRRQSSIVGTCELNYRVRDGNGWTLTVINTYYYVLWN